MNSKNPFFVTEISRTEKLILLTFFGGTCLVKDDVITAFAWIFPCGTCSKLSMIHHQDGKTMVIFEYDFTSSMSPHGFITREYELFLAKEGKIIKKVIGSFAFDSFSPKFTIKTDNIRVTVQTFDKQKRILSLVLPS